VVALEEEVKVDAQVFRDYLLVLREDILASWSVSGHVTETGRFHSKGTESICADFESSRVNARKEAPENPFAGLGLVFVNLDNFDSWLILLRFIAQHDLCHVFVLEDLSEYHATGHDALIVIVSSA
jgi:hypothetical protein